MHDPVLLEKVKRHEIEPCEFTKGMTLREKCEERLRYAKDAQLSHTLISVHHLEAIIEALP